MKILAVALFCKALIMLFVTSSIGLELAPDEAQYWTWSHLLDWGYYSKPPGIAWEIWLGTSLFGDTLFGVRFGAVVISTLIPLAVYGLGKTARLSDHSSLIAALIAAFTPMGFLVSFYATTDGGLILFWTLGLIVITRGVVKWESPNYPLLGIVIALGALFKWPIYLLWGVVAVAAIWIPPFRCSLAIVGVMLSSVGIFPSLIWNAKHGWPTLLHVMGQISGGGTSGGKPNFFDFFAAQAALLSPLFFLFLIFSFRALIKNNIERGLRFLGMVTIVLLGAYQCAALFQKMQGNWVVFAYPSGVVFLSWYMGKSKWIVPSFALAAVVAGYIFVIPVLQGKMGIGVPLKYSLLKECLGWECLERELGEVGYDPSEDFLAADSYQLTSLLFFYGPEHQRSYFLNLWQRRKNQYSYWPQLADERLGHSGFFITGETDPTKVEEALSPYFASVELVRNVPLVMTGEKVGKALLIYRVKRYNGKTPPESERY